ncbi:hypothetical protein JNUCC1_03373 [Lentibacillus sp. JNUCC-1]|uniref:hypothetical protein n=1 Tax=Lentibacillus sp. JNUCC-1 TaxID=2654513 RepID=UPI0012E85CAF|nr:hypothetical protein [Lentibacillus sp. JNUCC-1]MUV39495.1 hypothetical protein [Lentibacillus sp. JNUCC-1]
MDKQTIDKFITMPMAINILKQDQEQFKKFKMQNVYLDKLDAIIERLVNDFYQLKKDMISKHHSEVKKISSLKYKVDGEIIEYTADEIKALVSRLLRQYMFTVEAEEKERMW